MLRTLVNLYDLRFARTIVVALRAHDNSIWAFLKWFWNSKTFRVAGHLRALDKPLVVLLVATIVTQISSGIVLLIDWARFGTSGEWAFGLALFVSYPLIIVHIFALGVLTRRIAYYLLHPRATVRRFVARILRHQVKRLRRKHSIFVIAVTGTSGVEETGHAIAALLGQSIRVRYKHYGRSNLLVPPLVFFDQTPPRLWNVLGWMRLFGDNAAALEHPYGADVVIVILDPTQPGQARQLGYLKPDITVVTGLDQETSDGKTTIDSIASELLATVDNSKQVLVNGDDIAAKYLLGRSFVEYSCVTNIAHNYFAKTHSNGVHGQVLQLEFPSGMLDIETRLVGEAWSKAVLAAAATADMLGMHRHVIAKNSTAVSASAGRLHVLTGWQKTMLLDDTYEASPAAVIAALGVLYSARAAQRIAILGSVRGLGAHAHKAHREIGLLCDPRKLDMVVTIGEEARRWLAPAAREAGCQVYSFISPYDAGNYVRTQLKQKAVVLATGSQSGVFAEESLKPLLAHPADRVKLVRQSKKWLQKKAKQFKNATL